MDEAMNLQRLKSILPTRFSFGATSAIITNLGLIVGFDSLTNPRSSIIRSMLVIAIADNISDTLGMHVYQESQKLGRKEVIASTFSNYVARLLASLVFVVMIAVLPMPVATIVALIYGLGLLVLTSYFIARDSNVSPRKAVFEHIVVAVLVILVSDWLGKFLSSRL
jgi:VIT1/CCC1 family predicted Fe2+/Mn2+ transporter